MTATARAAAQKQTPAEKAQDWKDRIAELEGKIKAQQDSLDDLEFQAAHAALEGNPLPDMGAAEATLRALKRAKAMAGDQLTMAQAEVENEQRVTHHAAASKIADERVAAAKEIDSTLATLEGQLENFDKLGQRWREQARLAGHAVRPGRATSPSRVAGAVMAQAPTLFSVLGVERAPASIRQPLAEYVTAAQEAASKGSE